jgi:hypothetical protein
MIHQLAEISEFSSKDWSSYPTFEKHLEASINNAENKQ